MSRRMRARALAAALLLASLSGCVERSGYDWGRPLALATMTPEEVATNLDARVRKSAEGATGAATPRGR